MRDAMPHENAPANAWSAHDSATKTAFHDAIAPGPRPGRRALLAALGGAALASAFPGRLLAAGTSRAEQDKMRAYFETRLPNTLRQGDVLQKTRYGGIWAVRNPQALPRYFDEKVEWFINMPNPVGLQGLPHTMKQAFIEARKQAMVREIDVSQWPLIPGKTRPLAVVYGAWDCPYSRRMEADFRKAGISYYLVPGGLSEQSFALAQSLYAHPEFARIWHELITTGQTRERGPGDRKYPLDDATDFAFLFMMHGKPTPRTPLVVFADGELREGWDSADGMRVANQRLSQKRFFPNA
ncbi:Uncharacterised protein [Bordetella ansorpii]|uniref:Thioredoxin-like fold domain-containing protein n=1 Tax=Bordetella ansorpii TaxID=288768 RepID=A0A157PPH2_9BORD|nr:hypothetical protein [Bordetella ansorpii]SAI35244.1 Uncharacterised protein [Bordetella ansorpii]